MDKELAPAPGQTNICACRVRRLHMIPLRSFLALRDRGAGSRVSNRRGGVRPGAAGEMASKRRHQITGSDRLCGWEDGSIGAGRVRSFLRLARRLVGSLLR